MSMTCVPFATLGIGAIEEFTAFGLHCPYVLARMDWIGSVGGHCKKSSPRLESFLSIADKTGPQIGLAVDWELSAKGIMSYPALRRFVVLFNERIKR
jgi:hypothetical protein